MTDLNPWNDRPRRPRADPEKHYRESDDLHDRERLVRLVSGRHAGQHDGYRRREETERTQDDGAGVSARHTHDVRCGRFSLHLDQRGEHEQKRHEIRNDAHTDQDVVRAAHGRSRLAEDDEHDGNHRLDQQRNVRRVKARMQGCEPRGGIASEDQARNLIEHGERLQQIHPRRRAHSASPGRRRSARAMRRRRAWSSRRSPA